MVGLNCILFKLIFFPYLKMLEKLCVQGAHAKMLSLVLFINYRVVIKAAYVSKL